MKIELHKAADFDKINQQWASMNAPIILKRTKDPKVFTTKLKPGCETIVAELFLLTQMGISDDKKKSLEHKIWKTYFNAEIKRIEKKVAEFTDK